MSKPDVERFKGCLKFSLPAAVPGKRISVRRKSIHEDWPSCGRSRTSRSAPTHFVSLLQPSVRSAVGRAARYSGSARAASSKCCDAWGICYRVDALRYATASAQFPRFITPPFSFNEKNTRRGPLQLQSPPPVPTLRVAANRRAKAGRRPGAHGRSSARASGLANYRLSKPEPSGTGRLAPLSACPRHTVTAPFGPVVGAHAVCRGTHRLDFDVGLAHRVAYRFLTLGAFLSNPHFLRHPGALPDDGLLGCFADLG